MSDRDQSQSQGRILIQFGVVLLLLGLPAILVLLDRMPDTQEMIDHGDACINGAFLVALGLIWPRLELRRTWRLILFRLTFFASLTKWVGILLLVVWVARDEAEGVPTVLFDPLAPDGTLIGLGWLCLSVTLVIACVLAVYVSVRSRMARLGGLGERQPPSA